MFSYIRREQCGPAPSLLQQLLLRLSQATPLNATVLTGYFWLKNKFQQKREKKEDMIKCIAVVFFPQENKQIDINSETFMYIFWSKYSIKTYIFLNIFLIV